MLLLGVYTNAQDAFQNSGNLQIHTGASLAGSGNFTNVSSGALVNNGTLYVKGNLSNSQSSMTVGTGTLQLNGSSAQAVSGSQTFKTNNLVTNNAAGITLNNNLSVTAVHTFTAGLIATSVTPNYLIYEAGSSYTGDNDAKHVNGWVRKSGTTNFTFPVGDATYERTINVNTLSALSTFNAKYAVTTPNTGNVTSPVAVVDPNEYWTVDKVSGGDAQITMNWDNSKVAFPVYILSEIRVAHYTGGTSWTSEGGSASGDVTTTGTITSGTITTYSPFTFGSISTSLPLNFLNIMAQRKQGNTLVQWKTAQELNVDHFEVERSNKNSTTFNKIGSVPANNTSVVNEYEYTDMLPLEGTAFYRIRSVDKDGKTKYSATVAVSDNSSRNGSFYVLNNPAYQSIYLSTPASYKGVYDYELLGNAGQLVQKGKIHTEFNNIAAIPLTGNMLPGVYILSVHNEMYRYTQQVAVSNHR
jgi:hypothetical protein